MATTTLRRALLPLFTLEAAEAWPAVMLKIVSKLYLLPATHARVAIMDVGQLAAATYGAVSLPRQAVW